MKQRHSILISAALVMLFARVHPSAASERLIQAGEEFPKLLFQQQLTPEEISYLGLSGGSASDKGFSVADFNAELIVIEFLNRYCPSCQAQAPIMNEVYKSIAVNPKLNNRIKFVGIAAGNNLLEIMEYKKERQVSFPVFADADFTAYDAIGDPGGTPCIILVKKEGIQLTVAYSHVGLISSKEQVIKKIADALGADDHALGSATAAETIPGAEARMLDLKLSDTEIREMVAQSMFGVKGVADSAQLASLSKISLPKTGVLYRGEIISGKQKTILFSKIMSRKPICDACHGIHFIITFDSNGTVTNFYPIHLTKYGNALWDIKDVDRMRSMVVGRSLLQQKPFNPPVDAISSATMSSALIFNSINRMQATFKELKQVHKNL